MRIIYLTFVIIIFISSLGRAQTVSIPDPFLRTCIEKRFPATLDAKKNLILAEASKVKGVLSCSEMGIKNAEGVQYFTAIEKLNISYNALEFLPDLSPLSKLQILDVSDNHLVEIQDLGMLTELIDLDIKNNKIKRFPDVSKNVKLEVLSAHYNQFDTLPDLSGLVNLRLLFVENNNLVKLPEMTNLKSLTDFKCSNNKLKKIPALENQSKLKTLNISNNQLTELPLLPSSHTLQYFYFSDNQLSQLPDFTFYDSLQFVSFENNHFTFESFYPQAAIINDKNIYSFVPQKKISVGSYLEAKEGGMLLLETKTDTAVPLISYEWFHNGNKLPQENASKLLIKNINFNDSGFYFCKIQHPRFPELVLESDSFKVRISSCLNVADFSITVSGITCEKSGSLKIINSKGLSADSFELKGIYTGKIMKSAKGEFLQLTEPGYILTMSNGPDCIKKYPAPIEIPKDNCEDPFITPDGDGINDYYFIEGNGSALISDKWGNSIHKMELPNEWNGMSAGSPVPPGIYFVHINDRDKVIKITVVY